MAAPMAPRPMKPTFMRDPPNLEQAVPLDSGAQLRRIDEVVRMEAHVHGRGDIGGAVVDEQQIGGLQPRPFQHDLVDAALSAGSLVEGHRLVSLVDRVEALGKFLDTDDGKNLLAGTKRASNILAIEEKKDKRTFDGAPDASLFKLDEEKKLAAAIDQVKTEAGAAVAKEDFASAMSAMAKLRPAVDAFFDKVKVNDDDKAVRENRLKLLNEIREATRAVADFSKIQD